MNRGIFIVVDGMSGSGKSSALRTVADRLLSEGRPVLTTREPGGTHLAEKIREILLDSSNPMDTTTQLLLFNAGRRSHLQEVIEPAIQSGKIVLCDRFLASSLVFQSLTPEGDRDLDDAAILQAHELYCFGRKPDLSIYFHAPLEVCQARIASRAGAPKDRFEEYNDAFELAAADKFAQCGAIIGGPHIHIDANRSPDAVADEVYNAIVPYLES